jgi:AcrR family transcriptional regulator
MPATPVSRRDRPAKQALSRALIVQTGLRVLDADGMDALTMRRVGQELDTGAASLYVYVRNRDDLLEAMLDHALGTVEMPDPGEGDWRSRLSALVRRTIDAMARHDQLALVALGAIPSTENALIILEGLAMELKQAGLDDRTVSFAGDLLYLYITAGAAEQSAYRQKSINRGNANEYVETIDAVYASLDPARFPQLVGLGHTMLAGSGDERDAWALRVFLNGILATPAD